MKTPSAFFFSGFVCLCAISSAFAQGNFQNLGFEDATYPLVPDSRGLVLASDAIPGWTPHIGGETGNAVLYNTTTVGTAAVGVIEDLFGTNQSLHALNGSYSVILQAGVNPGPLGTGHVASAVEQTGLIPLGTRSITVKAASWGVVPGSLEVDVGGQTITLATVSSTSAFTAYGGDISQFAGQTEDLRIAAVPVTSTSFANWIIDDIQFSTSVIPEPSVLTLATVGTFLFGRRLLRVRQSIGNQRRQ